MNHKKQTIGFLIAVSLLLLISVPVFAAYSSHNNDTDTNAFLAAYPDAAGTKLDNCYLCHTSGTVSGKSLDSCDYCHSVYGLKPPHGDIAETLNAFGSDYDSKGRDQDAFSDIADVDSDGDGFTNQVEILEGRLPGNADDYPGVEEAPAVTYSREQIREMDKTTQFLTVDTAKSGDYYANYGGVHMWTLLQEAGVSDDATDITVYAVDGFSKSFQISDIKEDYKAGKFYTRYPWINWPRETWAEDGFKIPDNLFSGIKKHEKSKARGQLKSNAFDGRKIPGEICYMLAYEREGFPLQPGKMVVSSSKTSLEGEGPYRFLSPLSSPAVPDRSQWTIDRDDSPYPYNPNRPIIRNGDYCIKSVVAIKVAAPDQEYQYDWNGNSWKYLNDGEIVIYGAIEPNS